MVRYDFECYNVFQVRIVGIVGYGRDKSLTTVTTWESFQLLSSLTVVLSFY